MRPATTLLWVFVCAVAAACGGEPGRGDAGTDGRVYVPEPFTPTDATAAYCGEGYEAVEERITELLGELTVEEKAQLMAGASYTPVDGTWLVPGVERLGIPGLHMLDGPRGLSRMAGKNGTAFPVAAMRAATWAPELERAVGEAMAREALSAGADVLLAPTVNVLRHPRWGRAQETYSEDVHHTAEMAVAFIRGVQAEGVIASVKHFAANSIEDTRHHVDVVVDERTLREIYLPHFRRAVQDAQVGSVMTAYNQVNGLYCDLNAHLVAEILKDEWGFQGFVESDWFLGTHGDIDSLLAGLDIEMPFASYYGWLPEAVDQGLLDEAVLDRSVRRILRAQLCFGLDEREPVLDDPSARETTEHLSLAREVARRGVVLLRNELVDGNPALPLDGDELTTVVVLGRVADAENIGDIGSSAVTPSSVVTALEGISAAAGSDVEVTHIEGDSLSPDDRSLVVGADAAIVVTGLTHEDEGEGDIGAGDRESLALPAAEVGLIEAVASLNAATVVVVEAGSAVTVSEWVDEVPALLFAFYPGQEGGTALAEVLFGDASPSGRLPFSVPVDEADLPPFDNESESVTYDYWHGYRHLDRLGVDAQYPFGFGLSYTTFELSSLSVGSPSVAADGEVVATVEVANAGSRAGIATIQLYARALASRVERADKDLRAFAQIELEPGESGSVELSFPARDLAFYDVDAGAWEVEVGDYELLAGQSSADAALAGTVTIR